MDIDWLFPHVQWVFSGIGVFFLTLFITIFFKNRHASQKQKSGSHSNNFQSSKSININLGEKNDK